MRAALEEARLGLGHTSPNPAVGAVVVRGGRVIGRGYHRKAGEAHAEVEAIRGLSSARRAKGATLYVTLEPCSTAGRTPPCTEAIREAGIGEVVIGTRDPNPKHAGRGLGILRRAGIPVREGILKEECRALNRPFNKWVTTGMPWVIAKVAQTLDGRITRPAGETRWVTGVEARREVHRVRSEVDAILVGGATVRADNPRLTVRGVPGARQPLRVVVTRRADLPERSHIFRDKHRDRTVVYRNRSLRLVLKDLARRDVTSVLIEGGGNLLARMFDAELVDEILFYFAPLLTGGPAVSLAGKGAAEPEDAIRIVEPRYDLVGGDVRVRGLVCQEPAR